MTDLRMWTAIPKTVRSNNWIWIGPGLSGREVPREPKVPSADRRVIVGPMWFCLPELRYCGATTYGIRCKCGAQLAGHDFGDEDALP